MLFKLFALELSEIKIFYILIYEISETTYPIELKFSGIREGVNKLAFLEFQSNPTRLRKMSKYGILGN